VPEVNVKLPEVPNNEWRDAQFRFDGAWMPDVDGVLIGPDNYQTLQNLRYKDSGLEGVNGYTKVNTTALTAPYTDIKTGHQLRVPETQSTYTLVHVQDPATGQGRVYSNRTAIGSQGDFATNRLDTTNNAFWADSSVNLVGRFSDAPDGHIGYANGEEFNIFGGDETRVAAVFSLTTSDLTDTSACLPIDVTEKVNNSLDNAANRFEVNAGGKPFVLVMTTRPVIEINLYISSSNPNTTVSDTTAKTWTASGWSADWVWADGTDNPAGTSMGQSGTLFKFLHSENNAIPVHFEELYLYAYLLELSAGDADIYRITTNSCMTPVKDVWDGVYRQPIQFQAKDGTEYYDYTLQVNESSDVNVPIGGQLDGWTSSDKVYIMFEDRMSAIKFTMLGDLVNAAASEISMKYWNGANYSDLTIEDGTVATVGQSLGQSGLIYWTPPTDEETKTEFGSYGYIYELSFSGTLTGTKGSTAEVLIDLCTGVPAQLSVDPCDAPGIYGTRYLGVGHTGKGEGNRLDYSVANAPNTWNGFDSSDNGKQSLFFGGVEPIVATTQVYNRFGASVYAMLLVLKRNETYILVGDNPANFITYDVAKTVGCIAPMSLATAEIGLDLGNGLTRNVAIWLSHSGPVMFDGAILTPIPGVRSYFDPNDGKYVDFSVAKDAKGWVDPVYKEYNLLLPSGSASKNNVWLVYDLIRRKWFTKDTGQSAFPQCGFEVGDQATGQRYVYGGYDSGFMIQLESGNTWGDSLASGIQQKVKTGDFFPSQNIWDETTIRKWKLFMKKLTNSGATNNLAVSYYKDTETNSGQAITWQDEDTDSGISFDWEDSTDYEWTSSLSSLYSLNLDVGLQRLLKVVQDLNRKGWAHAFEFELTTTDVSKGFQPIMWGVRYRVERKDDTATS
jgi:hypothetical protein